MYTTRTIPSLAAAAALCTLVACSSSSPNEHPHPKPDATPAVSVQDAATPDLPITTVVVPRNSLGASCASDSDCNSGFCTDGVCCDSKCDQTCYACNLPAAAGHCAALTNGGDPQASPPCVAPSACVLLASSRVPACRLVDGATCGADADCVSGHCRTFYVDADGDGYGTSQEARFCEELNAAPPPGFAAYSGDCCDLDTGANPGFDNTQFLQMPDACGSFDWNCNGVIAQEQMCSTGPVACGDKCVLNFFGPITLFTEACN